MVGGDLYPRVRCDFDTIDETFTLLNSGRDCDFALQMRDTAVCALRLKQGEQANTELPMLPALVSLLDEWDCGGRCICQMSGGEPSHRDVFDDSPDDNYSSVDSFKERAARQRFLINLDRNGRD